ncbi:MAG: Mo-dependent nitrogenase C-terminal domain-containing protein [Lyngbya sp. HA4199-MV5]|nr:Mo-dependent nitrogenase C-terminal domain-containing protein [Lyngbya sp. HA4199-MV5]
MKTSHATVSHANASQIVWAVQKTSAEVLSVPQGESQSSFAPLQPIRQWLDAIEVQNPATANLLCRVIPSRCPFERTVKLFDRTLFSIPPLCKLNPFYEQVVGLRFRALCYLADECHEDVSHYC